METQQSQKTETSMTRERLMDARSSYLLGNRYCHHCLFCRKEVVDHRIDGSKMRGNYCSDSNIFKSEIKK